HRGLQRNRSLERPRLRSVDAKAGKQIVARHCDSDWCRGFQHGKTLFRSFSTLTVSKDRPQVTTHLEVERLAKVYRPIDNKFCAPIKDVVFSGCARSRVLLTILSQILGDPTRHFGKGSPTNNRSLASVSACRKCLTCHRDKE